MKKLSLAILLISTIYAQLTFNIANQCTCSDFTLQKDCYHASPICTWNLNGSSCETVSCSVILDQTNCSENKNCMWDGKECVDFTFCDQLTGASQEDCYAKSINCPQSDGTNCASKDALKSCSSYNDQNSCNLKVSNDGVCLWKNTECSEVTSCGDLNSTSCGDVGKACLWNTTLNSCTEGSCGQFERSAYCNSYLVSLNKQNYQLCQWDDINNICNTANDTSALTADDCYSITRGTYSWQNSTQTCESCAGKIIYVVIMAIFMIMI